MKLKQLLFALILLIVYLTNCKKDSDNSFVTNKISELKSKPVYNPPASIWKWEYKGTTYYYVTANCCDQYNELYNTKGELICYPDGGFTGQGDGKCPFNVFSSPPPDITKTLIWKDER